MPLSYFSFNSSNSSSKSLMLSFFSLISWSYFSFNFLNLTSKSVILSCFSLIFFGTSLFCCSLFLSFAYLSNFLCLIFSISLYWSIILLVFTFYLLNALTFSLIFFNFNSVFFNFLFYSSWYIPFKILIKTII